VRVLVRDHSLEDLLLALIERDLLHLMPKATVRPPPVGGV